MKWRASTLWEGRLRKKVLLILLLVGVIPLVILGGLALLSLDLFHKIDVKNIEENLLNQKAEEINAFFEKIRGSFQLQVAFEQISDIELSQQHFLLNQYLQEFPALEEIAFLSLSGRETALFNRTYYPQGMPPEELLDQSLNKKFLQAKAGTFYFGPLYFTPKGPMVDIATPVFNRNKIIISVLTGRLNLSELQTVIARSRLGNSGYVYLVNSDGFLLAHSQPKKLTPKSLRAIEFVRSSLENNPENLTRINRYQSFWGEPVAAATLNLERNLALFAEWPITDADRVVNTVRNQVITFSLLVLAATLLAGVFFAHRVVNPIKVLEQGAYRVAQGKFDKPVEIKTHDELEDLGVAFNKMMVGLKQLEELKKEFVFIAAHELRTPVTAIRGFLSMVFEGDAGPVNSKIKELLNEVAAANDRLIQLVDDLLQVARAEAGRLAITVKAVDVIQPIKEIARELRPLADKKNIELVYQPPPDLPLVLADTQRLKEIMANLVGNAIKYTLDQGVVTISHERKDRTLITHIKDTGIGIAKKDQAKLFEKFYRVQTEHTQMITGTGLGLFIVKQIVEKMEGKIWVISEEGAGSIFSFALPIA